MKVSIIIINYNTPQLIYNCLESILKYVKVEYEIILVENGSKPELQLNDEKLKMALKDNSYKFVLSEINVGFGGGNNIGVKNSTGDVLWLLNSDTLLIDDSINELLALVLKDETIGVASPLLYNDLSCKTLQHDFYANFQSISSLVFRTTRGRHNFQKEKSFETDVVVGASMILRKEVFERIGGFDSKYFMFFEDDDLCFRVKKLNLKIVVYCRSKIVHLQGKSIARNADRKKMYYKSQDYFWTKNYGIIPSLLMRLIRMPYKVLKTLQLLIAF